MRTQAGIRPLTAAVAGLSLPADHVLVQAPRAQLRVGDLGGLAQAGVAFAGERVALCFADPFVSISAILALDGRANAMLLLSPDLPADTAGRLMRQAGVSRLLSDRHDLPAAERWSGLGAGDVAPRADLAPADTDWLLTTSGTTGTPRIVKHSRASIVRAVRAETGDGLARWGMLYDPSRFAGTQVFAQALLGGGTLLTSIAGMTTGAVIDWMVEERCSHISATPSLWRRILMAPSAGRLPLRQVTLGGEIVDAPLLRGLSARFPDARIIHIYASTEAGAGFAVRDGLAGFPARWLDEMVDGVRLAVREGILWLRPAGGAHTAADHIVRDEAGYIRTGDRIEERDGRMIFLGREDMTLNVGGVAVQVEAVEEIVHAHPSVAQCRVAARPSGMMGNLLTLSVVAEGEVADPAALRQDIALWCRERLPAAARPATIRIVPEIAVTSAGKQGRVP